MSFIETIKDIKRKDILQLTMCSYKYRRWEEVNDEQANTDIYAGLGIPTVHQRRVGNGLLRADQSDGQAWDAHGLCIAEIGTDSRWSE